MMMALREKKKKEKHIFIETQLHCVFSYTHNFQISAFALHIKIFHSAAICESYANPWDICHYGAVLIHVDKKWTMKKI
jgi:hypothetical protein